MHLGTLVATMTVLSVFSIAAIRGNLGEYLVRWTWVLGAMVMLVPAWVVLRLLTRDRHRLAAALALGTVGASVWVTLGFADELPPRPVPIAPTHAEIGRLLQPLRAQTPAGTTVQLRAYPADTWIFVVPTLAIDLERSRVRVAVRPDLATEFGQFRAERRPDLRIVVATGGDIARLLRRPDLRLVSTAGRGTTLALFAVRTGRVRDEATHAR